MDLGDWSIIVIGVSVILLIIGKHLKNKSND